MPYFGDETTDPFLWIEAYQRMMELKPKVIVPGHGPVTDLKQVQIQLDYMEECIKWTRQYIEEGGKEEELDTNDEFPILDYEPYDNFEALFNASKRQMYKMVLKEMGKK